MGESRQERESKKMIFFSGLSAVIGQCVQILISVKLHIMLCVCRFSFRMIR